jgi:uncharacterized membrane protein YphA (DoxX/SURF4 family)
MKFPDMPYRHAEACITNWMASYSVWMLRLSLGGVFFWFGLLKFFSDLSPAEALAERTLETLTLGVLAPHVSITLLACWETAIGLGLLLRVFPSGTLMLLFLHMLGTLTPFVLFPNELFTHAPYAPTLEAQYILKNFVLISAGCVIGAASRDGGVRAVPDMGPAETSHQPWYGRRAAHVSTNTPGLGLAYRYVRSQNGKDTCARPGTSGFKVPASY